MGDAYTKEAYKLIYQHPDWQSTAQEYEDRFAANLYHSGPVLQTASNVLTQLSDMLVSYYRVKNLSQEQAQSLAAVGEVAVDISERTPDDWEVLEEALLRENSGEGAGQIGRWKMGDYVGEQEQRRLDVGPDYPLFTTDADRLNRENIHNVLNYGNLREQMTMLYNGMFLNGGKTREEIEESRSLKNLLLNVTPEEQELMKKMKVDSYIEFDLLQEMEHYGKKEDLFDTYSMARDLERGREKTKGRGNWFTRWVSGMKRAFSAAFSSRFTRGTKKKEEQAGLGLEHYNRLGLGLSQREMSNGLDENGNLKWKEGQSYYRMNKPVTAEGMLKTAGPSGTTMRMLGAYRLLGASKIDLLNFRLALIAWMVSSRDHSLYEILVGSHNAGVRGWEDMSEAANMYRTVDPLTEELTRQEFAPDKRFPHETIYLKIYDQYRRDVTGKGLMESDSDGGRFEGVSAYKVAAGTYTTTLYKIMNTSAKYGDLIGHIRVWMMDKTLSKDASEDYRRQIKGIQKTGFDMARLSYRMLSDALTSWASKKPGEGREDEEQAETEELEELAETEELAESEELEAYSPERARQEEGYKTQWLDMSHAFRGITYRGGKLNSAMKRKGKFVTETFYSTSLLPSVAMHFYDICKDKDENKAIFRFRLEGKGAVNITTVSSYGEEEMEVLIPRGSTFQVLDVPRPAFYNTETEEVIEESSLSEGEKAAVYINLEQDEENVWQKIQIVDVQEISGPESEKQAKMSKKRKERLDELLWLDEMWDEDAHTA